jgi:hypothetical protein
VVSAGLAWVTDARDGDDVDPQTEYDADPELQGLLSRQRSRPRCTGDRADVIADDGNDADDATTE